MQLHTHAVARGSYAEKKSNMKQHYKVIIGEPSLYFDGSFLWGSKSGMSGAVLELKYETVKIQEKFNNKSMNYSEFLGLKIGLLEALKRGVVRLNVYGDSMLVIKSMQGRCRIKASTIKNIYEECLGISKKFHNIYFQWVSRKNNTHADELTRVNIEGSFSEIEKEIDLNDDYCPNCNYDIVSDPLNLRKHKRC